MSSRLTPDLVVGFEEVDGQHRTLFQRLDAAANAAKLGDAVALRDALAKLGDCLVAHFGAEESFMAAARYPERGRHKAAHDLFMQEFAQLTRDADAAGASVPVVQAIATRIPEWLKFHIQVNDVPLGRFLAGKRFRPEVEPARAEKPRSL